MRVWCGDRHGPAAQDLADRHRLLLSRADTPATGRNRVTAAASRCAPGHERAAGVGDRKLWFIVH